MKALITGAYGFIGRNLFQRLMYDDCFSEIILLSRRLRTKIHSTPNKTIKQYAIKLGCHISLSWKPDSKDRS